MSVTVSEPGMDSDALRSVDHHREAAPDSSPEAASAPVACPGMHKDGRTQVRPKLWLDGALLDAESAQIPLTTHALHYGSGVFEGIRSYATANGGTAVFRLPEHLRRMQKGCALLDIPFDSAQASQAILQTLRANAHRDAYIRPLAWCGTGSIGLDVSALSKHLMVTTLASKVHLAVERVRLTRSPWKRNPAGSLPPLKLCGAYVNSILAKREAKQRGFDESLFVDDDGLVVECTGANVFMVRAGRVSAVEHADALAGITRDSVIALTGADTRKLAYEELRDADEVFVCGTAAEVLPIGELDGRRYGESLTREIAAQYQRAVRGEDASRLGWLSHV